jgi:hypothetical protein
MDSVTLPSLCTVNVGALSSKELLASLTTEQIAQLIGQIDSLIATENKSIIDSQSQISILQTNITQPITGYQAVYDSTMVAYSTAVILYLAQNDLVQSTESRLNTLYNSLSSVYLQEASDLSTMRGYQKQYSTLLLDMNLNNTALNSEQLSYLAMSTSMGSYVNDYMVALSSFQLETDPVGMSTLSTTMGLNITQRGTLAPFIQSTLFTMSTAQFLSTTYSYNINGFMSTGGSYASLKDSIFSTLEQLWAEQARLTSSITDYDQQLWLLGRSTTVEFASLKSEVVTFYKDKLTQIRNQVLQVNYAVKEWESFIGYTISEIMILKMQLYTSIDLLSYQIQQSTDPDTQTALSLTRSGYTTTQNTIQGIVSVLNPLKVQIGKIYANISDDISLRELFIQTQEKMTNIEISVLESPSLKELNKSIYLQYQASLARNVIDINASMNRRQKLIRQNMDSLMMVFNTQWSLLQSVRTFMKPDDIPTESVPFSIDPTDFQVTPPLVYS